MTALFSGYVAALLDEAAANPAGAWQAKDCAVYLVTALVRSRTYPSICRLSKTALRCWGRMPLSHSLCQARTHTAARVHAARVTASVQGRGLCACAVPWHAVAANERAAVLERRGSALKAG